MSDVVIDEARPKLPMRKPWVCAAQNCKACNQCTVGPIPESCPNNVFHVFDLNLVGLQEKKTDEMLYLSFKSVGLFIEVERNVALIVLEKYTKEFEKKLQVDTGSQVWLLTPEEVEKGELKDADNFAIVTCGITPEVLEKITPMFGNNEFTVGYWSDVDRRNKEFIALVKKMAKKKAKHDAKCPTCKDKAKGGCTKATAKAKTPVKAAGKGKAKDAANPLPKGEVKLKFR